MPAHMHSEWSNVSRFRLAFSPRAVWRMWRQQTSAIAKPFGPSSDLPSLPQKTAMTLVATIVLLGVAFIGLVFLGACLAKTVALACL